MSISSTRRLWRLSFYSSVAKVTIQLTSIQLAAERWNHSIVVWINGFRVPHQPESISNNLECSVWFAESRWTHGSHNLVQPQPRLSYSGDTALNRHAGCTPLILVVLRIPMIRTGFCNRQILPPIIRPFAIVYALETDHWSLANPATQTFCC